MSLEFSRKEVKTHIKKAINDFDRRLEAHEIMTREEKPKASYSEINYFFEFTKENKRNPTPQEMETFRKLNY